MVFRSRRRGNSLRPVNRIKHVFDKQGGLIANTQVATNIATANDDPVLANTDECLTGSTINAFFIVCEVTPTNAAALANCYFLVGKSEGGNITLPQPNVVGASDNKRYVIHQEMVMMSTTTVETLGNPRTLFKGVIVIPKGMRRMGPNDVWQLNLKSIGTTTNFCFQVHYKEFR